MKAVLVELPAIYDKGRARPNAQVALLINLVKQYPDTVHRFAAI